PCSIHVYQVGLTPHSCATSSRRSPGVRRRGPGGKPTASGDNRSRCARIKSPSARAGVESSGGGAFCPGSCPGSYAGSSDGEVMAGETGVVDTRIAACLVPVQAALYCSDSCHACAGLTNGSYKHRDAKTAGQEPTMKHRDQVADAFGSTAAHYLTS